MDKITRVRQEIERRAELNTTQFKKGLISVETLTARDSQLLGLNTFLDTLSEEPDKSLEEAAIGNYYGGGYVPKNQELREIALKTKEVQSFIAGAEWQASQMPMPEDTVLFQKGVAEGRRLEREDMMKDAVEGTVMDFSSTLPRPQVDIRLNPHKYHTGDKVRIVVLKAEEK